MKIVFYTLGCKVNQYESEALAGRFAAAGYEIGREGEDADIYLVNSCTVTAEGDRKTRQQVRRIRREHPQSVVALAGCWPQAFPEEAAALTEADIVSGNQDRGRLLELTEAFLRDRKRIVEVVPHRRGEAFEAMKAENFGERTRAFVKIQDGCENYCTYCIIPFARGPVRSKQPDDLRKELEDLALAGYREVVLTGINLSSYGRELGLCLADAVELACSVEGLERVRLGSLEPELLTPQDICRIAKQKKVCPQFHLALQSGCDKTLKRMNRHYDTAVFREIAEEMRAQFPGAAITTDMIVGFPGETEEDFEQSLQFAREMGFARIHAFPYSMRTGTTAARWTDQVPQAEKKRRNEILIAEAAELRRKFLSGMVGTVAPVLFEEHHRDGRQVGYTPNYTPVAVEEKVNLQGHILPVLITGLSDDGCVGILQTAAAKNGTD